MSEIPKPKRVKRGWMNLVVDEIISESSDTKSFILRDADEGGRPWDFVAGQYLSFRYDDIAERPLVRSYTIASAPRLGDHVRITVKKIPEGLISSYWVDQVTQGQILRARGPMGAFVYDPQKDQPVLWMVAAGSGVTPFTSIIQEFQNRLGTEGAPRAMRLLVAFRSPEEQILRSVLDEAAQHPGIKIYRTYTRTRASDGLYGRPDKSMLNTLCHSEVQTATFMSCGPAALMNMTKDFVMESGAEAQRFKQESFFS